MTVTDRAKEELKRIRALRGLKPGQNLKLATPPVWIGEGEFGLVVDEEKSEDHVVTFQGVVVLLVEAGLARRLSSAVFDYKDSPDGPRFTLDVF